MIGHGLHWADILFALMLPLTGAILLLRAWSMWSVRKVFEQTRGVRLRWITVTMVYASTGFACACRTVALYWFNDWDQSHWVQFAGLFAVFIAAVADAVVHGTHRNNRNQTS